MRRTILTVLATLISFVFGLPYQAQDAPKVRPKKTETYIKTEVHNDTFHGRTALALPQATDRGNWTGTWIYINRDVRFALWMKEEGDKIVAKMQYLGAYLTPETFETDWSGQANYTVQEKPATFSFVLDDITDDRIEASWDWVLNMHGSGREEHGKLELYRAGDGRRLVMHFKDFDRVIERAGQRMIHDKPQAWTFTKISRRLARWEELPL